MSNKAKRLRRNQRIATVADEISHSIERQLQESGQAAVSVSLQNQRTGSVYLKIHVYRPDGQRIKSGGAGIRVSDHRPKGCRHINFSQPAHRYYGISCQEPHTRLNVKLKHIVQHIQERLAKRASVEFGTTPK